MFRFVRLSAVIGLLFFAFVCFWPAVNKEHAGTTKVADTNRADRSADRLHNYIDSEGRARFLHKGFCNGTQPQDKRRH